MNMVSSRLFHSLAAAFVLLSASWNAGGSENGIYYADPPADWRFYQARGGGLTVSVPEGHSFVKALFTYNNKNGGVLIAPDGTTQVNTGAEFAFSGSTATFTVGSTTGATNAQARIYTITLEYK